MKTLFSQVRFAVPVLALAMLALNFGCQEQQPAKSPTVSESTASELTPITPTPMPVAYTAPAPAPAPAYNADAMMTSTTPMMSASASTGNSYTVRKGDTLWKIAASHYGSGKKWHEIASANPGLSPSTLKVGQTITLP